MKKFLKSFIFLFIILAMVGFFTSFQFGKQQVYTYEMEVTQNDTIWNIAKDVCKNNSDLNIQNVVLEIKSINKLNTSDIYVGQVLNIPIY